jgi:hypothetical protein
MRSQPTGRAARMVAKILGFMLPGASAQAAAIILN